jgi:hypothetical protein
MGHVTVTAPTREEALRRAEADLRRPVRLDQPRRPGLAREERPPGSGRARGRADRLEDREARLLVLARPRVVRRHHLGASSRTRRAARRRRGWRSRATSAGRTRSVASGVTSGAAYRKKNQHSTRGATGKVTYAGFQRGGDPPGAEREAAQQFDEPEGDAQRGEGPRGPTRILGVPGPSWFPSREERGNRPDPRNLPPRFSAGGTGRRRSIRPSPGRRSWSPRPSAALALVPKCSRTAACSLARIPLKASTPPGLTESTRLSA